MATLDNDAQVEDAAYEKVRCSKEEYMKLMKHFREIVEKMKARRRDETGIDKVSYG